MKFSFQFFYLVRALVFVVAMQAISGADFTNLGFDDADTTGLGPPDRPAGADTTEKLLPGWELFYGDTPALGLSVNTPEYGDVDIVRLFDGFENPGFKQGRFAIEFHRINGNSKPWTLLQSGTIPPQARYLVYRNNGAEMQLQISGNVTAPINRQEPSGLAPLTNLVYDVSAYAGQVIALGLVGPFVPPPPYRDLGGISYIDSIRFASEPPRLSIVNRGKQIRVSWPASTIGYVLQETTSLGPNALWDTSQVEILQIGSELIATVESGGMKGRFFRLGLDCQWCAVVRGGTR